MMERSSSVCVKLSCRPGRQDAV